VNGFELCKRIRLADISIGIIMLTSLHELADKKLGYDAGADDYIVKPFDFQELLLKIGALLKRSISAFLSWWHSCRITRLWAGASIGKTDHQPA
jgi:DNA-binding response OmpR family regulator